MTVKELKESLAELPDDSLVVTLYTENIKVYTDAYVTEICLDIPREVFRGQNIYSLKHGGLKALCIMAKEPKQ